MDPESCLPETPFVREASLFGGHGSFQNVSSKLLTGLMPALPLLGWVGSVLLTTNLFANQSLRSQKCQTAFADLHPPNLPPPPTPGRGSLQRVCVLLIVHGGNHGFPKAYVMYLRTPYPTNSDFGLRRACAGAIHPAPQYKGCRWGIFTYSILNPTSAASRIRELSSKKKPPPAAEVDARDVFNPRPISLHRGSD